MTEAVGMKNAPVILRIYTDDVPPPTPTPPIKFSSYVLHDATYREPISNTPGGYRIRETQRSRGHHSKGLSNFSEFFNYNVAHEQNSKRGEGRPSKFAEATGMQKVQQYLKDNYPYLSLDDSFGESSSRTLMKPTLNSVQAKETPGSLKIPKSKTHGRTHYSLFSKTLSQFSTKSTQEPPSTGEQKRIPFSPLNKPIKIKRLNMYSAIQSFSKERGPNPLNLSPCDFAKPTAKILDSAYKKRLITSAIEKGNGKQGNFTKLDARCKKRLMQTYDRVELKDLISPSAVSSIKDIPDTYNRVVNWNLTRMYRSIGENGELLIRPPEMPIHVNLGDLNNAVLGSLALVPPPPLPEKKPTKPLHKYSSKKTNQSKSNPKNLLALHSSIPTAEASLSTQPTLIHKFDKEVKKKIQKPQKLKNKTISPEIALLQEKVDNAKEKYKEVKKLAEKCDKELTKRWIHSTQTIDLNKLLKPKKYDTGEQIQIYYKVKKLLFEENMNVVSVLNNVLRRKKKQVIKPLLDMKQKSPDEMLIDELNREKADAYLSRLFYKNKKTGLRIGDKKFKIAAKAAI